jgi:hypothetical protein
MDGVKETVKNWQPDSELNNYCCAVREKCMHWHISYVLSTSRKSKLKKQWGHWKHAHKVNTGAKYKLSQILKEI